MGTEFYYSEPNLNSSGSIIVLGIKVFISNEELANAIEVLPSLIQEIILMSFFIGLNDREIIEETYLFVYLDFSKDGVPYHQEYINDHVKRCVNHSGFDKLFHAHLVRHKMASLIAEYCSWEVLKNCLGHTDRTTSKIYCH